MCRADLTKIARLSWSEDGARQAKELLAKDGIALVTERHLPKTYLDGVALRLGDGRPVIGLTLRYDRIDNFWFCLLHELAHVGRHMDHDRGEAFVDDLTLRNSTRDRETPGRLRQTNGRKKRLSRARIGKRAQWGTGRRPWPS